MGGKFSEFRERRDENETDESKLERKESEDERGWEKTDPESWMKEVAKQVEEQEVEERLKAEGLVKEVRRELERQERIEAEERRAAEEWMKAVAEEIEKMEKEEELEKEKRGVERPRGWDPTTDDWNDYEKDIAKGFEVTGATEEEMKERWQERYVEEMQNIIEKEPQTEKSSPDSLEGTGSSEDGESRARGEQSEEYVESGDGTATKMIMEQPSKDTLEQEKPKPETPSVIETVDTPSDNTESSEPTLEESDVEAKSKETSQDSEKKEYDTYTERRITHHRREIDSHSEEENSEPSEKFREEYESRSKPTQFSENDRVPGSLSRVVDQVEIYTEYQNLPSMIDGQVEGYSEPGIGRVEHSEEPKRKTSKQEVYEDSIEDIPSYESEHEYSSEQNLESKEKPTHQDEDDDESEAVHETESHFEERMEEDDAEAEDVQESSYERELHRDESKDVISKVFEDASKGRIESSRESSESQTEEVENELEDATEQKTFDESVDEDEREESTSKIKEEDGNGKQFKKLREEMDSSETPQLLKEHEKIRSKQTIESTTERTDEEKRYLDEEPENQGFRSFGEVSEIDSFEETIESVMSESKWNKPRNEEAEHIEETGKAITGEESRKTEDDEIRIYENPTDEKEFEIESNETPIVTEARSRVLTEKCDNANQEIKLEEQLPDLDGSFHKPKEVDEGQPTRKSVEVETNDRLLSKVQLMMKEKKIPKSFDEFENLLDQNSHLRESKDFEKQYYQAKMFYQIIDDLSDHDYSHFSAYAVWKMMSEKYRIPVSTICKWFNGKVIERLIRKTIGVERQRLGLDFDHKADWKSTRTSQGPKSTTEFIQLLARHRQLRDRKDFDRKYKDVVTYFVVKEIIAKDPNTNISELARQLNYPRHTIQNWARDISRPKLITELLMNERLRNKYESKLSQEAHRHRIDPSIVYEVLRPLKEIDNLSSVMIADTLERLLRQQRQCKIVFAELRHYNHEHDQQLLTHIQKIVKSKKVEKILNERLGYDDNPDIELRLGVVDSKLYMWTRDSSQFDFANLFADELFFFDKAIHKQLIKIARSHLGLKGDYNLSELVRQVTDYKEDRTSSIIRRLPDFKHESEHIQGMVLKFLLDAQGILLEDLEVYIQRIGAGKQILNPRIVDDETLKVLLARLFAIIASDGHIKPGYIMEYFEKDDLRQEIVSSHLMKLGNVVIKRIYDEETDTYTLQMPSVLGRIMAKLGIPVGDKVLQGIVIPPFILYGSPEIQAAYLEEVIPEEGWFTIYVKEGDWAKIVIKRSVVHYDLDKKCRYNFTQKTLKSTVELFLEKGEKKVKDFGNGRSAIFFEFSAESLEQLLDSKNQQITLIAKNLLSVALENPPELLINERSLCEMNGIFMTDPNLHRVSLSEKTGRISASWYVQTSSQADVARWGLFAPPNDVRKQSRLALWMKRHPELVEKARQQLSGLGVLQEQRMDVTGTSN